MKAFEEILKGALEERVKDVTPAAEMLQSVKREAAMRRKETVSMKFGMKKLAVVAAVCLMSVTCYAAVRFAGAVTHSTQNITRYADLAKAEEKVGFEAKYVEAFQNGFTFYMAGTGETQGYDEEGNAFGEVYQMLSISYKNEAGDDLSLTVENGDPYADAGEETLGYSSQTFQFMPPDAELTEEAKALQEAGELIVSYGSDEVSVEQMENYTWVDNGLYYSLTASDMNFGESGMKAMAEEIMQQ